MLYWEAMINDWDRLVALHQLDTDDTQDVMEFCTSLGYNTQTATFDELEYVYRLWINEP